MAKLKQSLCILAILGIILVNTTNCFMKNADSKQNVDYLEQLNKFCIGKNIKLCSNANLMTNFSFLKQKKIKSQQDLEERIQHMKALKNERQLKLKQQDDIKKKMRVHFLDRYV